MMPQSPVIIIQIVRCPTPLDDWARLVGIVNGWKIGPSITRITDLEAHDPTDAYCDECELKGSAREEFKRQWRRQVSLARVPKHKRADWKDIKDFEWAWANLGFWFRDAEAKV